jgi:hypothetical protein
VAQYGSQTAIGFKVPLVLLRPRSLRTIGKRGIVGALAASAAHPSPSFSAARVLLDILPVNSWS